MKWLVLSILSLGLSSAFADEKLQNDLIKDGLSEFVCTAVSSSGHITRRVIAESRKDAKKIFANDIGLAYVSAAGRALKLATWKSDGPVVTEISCGQDVCAIAPRVCD